MRLFLALLTLATPAPAQQVPAILSAISGDWDGNGIPDAALLVPGPEESATLILYRGGFSGMEPVLTLPGVALAGIWAGQAPRLEARGERGFALLSEQTGIGRTPWMQAISVVWQGAEPMVAGFDYSFYDRLDLAHYGECSVDLLTGRYSLTHSPGEDAPEVQREGRTDTAAFPLAELPFGWMPAPCGELYD